MTTNGEVLVVEGLRERVVDACALLLSSWRCLTENKVKMSPMISTVEMIISVSDFPLIFGIDLLELIIACDPVKSQREAFIYSKLH